MAGLRNNEQNNQIRRDLEARNLYTPDSPYALNNTKLISAINSIAGLIPGKSIDITNTVIGRALGIGETPITKVGFQEYARHLAQSVTSYGISDAIPSVNFRNMFDGNPNTMLLTKKEDYRITRDETKSSLGKLIQDITNQQPKLPPATFTNVGNLAPNDKFPNFYDFLRNSGKGQLNQFYANLSRNYYIPSSEDFMTASADQGYQVNRVTKALLNKQFYPTNDPANFPNGQEASDDFRSEIVTFREETAGASASEYGSPTQADTLGSTKKRGPEFLAQNLPFQEKASDFEFAPDSYGFDENVENQIVWGRDTDLTRFGVRSGAILQAKGLLQARGARGYFDMTKKKMTAPDGTLMYNGSPLTRHVDGTVDRNRQHTIEDPYNNYAKLIRFRGNEIYGGPVESVINKTVIPKFHPVVDTSNKVNNRNMMFSIENLAYILNDKGYLGDGQGTKVPQSEVGRNRGRLMWFAPYDVEVSETAAAKWETNELIGRSEPIYTYKSSERSARLSFKLLVDYPPMVDGQSHGDIAKFFAFGGQITTNELKNIDLDKENAKLKDLEVQLAAIQPDTVMGQPNDLQSGDKGTFYFHNDGDSVTFDIENKYEDGVVDGGEQNDDGLNIPFQDQVVTLVTEILNPETYQFYTLEFLGRASRLFYDQKREASYNEALGRRRAFSLMAYVEDKFKQYNNGLTFAKAGIKATFATIGSSGGSNEGVLETNISLLKVKQERSALIRLGNSGAVVKKPVPLTPSQLDQKRKLESDVLATKSLIAAATKVQSDERLFNEVKITDRAMKGFESMKKMTFSPIFHSQTPEDFHRRLTFLHQCTRQGNSVVNKATEDAGVPVSRNAVFGRPPICEFRLGDMFFSKVIIETVDFDYSDGIWDLNPEGMGMQYMIANIDISMKIIGGQSLKGAIDVIQNAESFNYYANSTFYTNDVYQFARRVEAAQQSADTTLIDARGKARFGDNLDATGNNI